MKDVVNWVEALKISPENLTAWQAEAPSDTPLLVWCLREKKVALDQYFEWAVETFELPLLNSLFFHEAFRASDLSDLRKSAAWTPWMFPVSIWEDVVTVACVEPPTDIIGNFCFVLADPSALLKVWPEFSGKVQGDAEPVGLNKKPSKFVLNLEDLPAVAEPASPQTESMVLELTSAPRPTPAPPPQPKPKPASAKKAPATSGSAPDAVAMTSTFAELRSLYQTSFVMKCTDSIAKVYAWDESLAELDREHAGVDLGYPSFLRIVARTLQPYHGYVVASPVHDDFFGSLNLIVLPGCVTAVPIHANGEFWGILVALGSEATQTNEALQKVVEAGERLSQFIGNSVITNRAA